MPFLLLFGQSFLVAAKQFRRQNRHVFRPAILADRHYAVFVVIKNKHQCRRNRLMPRGKIPPDKPSLGNKPLCLSMVIVVHVPLHRLK